MESPVNAFKPINITLSLKEVKCLNFTLTNYAKENKRPISSDGYEFEFKSQTNINEKDKTFIVNFSTKLYRKENSKKNELAELISLVIFGIVNYSEIIINEQGLLVPDQLISTCTGIALSTTRGMYAVKLEQTLYSNAVVPLIDSKLFVPKKPEQIA